VTLCSAVVCESAGTRLLPPTTQQGTHGRLVSRCIATFIVSALKSAEMIGNNRSKPQYRTVFALLLMTLDFPSLGRFTLNTSYM